MTTFNHIRMLVAGLASICYLSSNGVSQDLDTDAGERKTRVRVEPTIRRMTSVILSNGAAMYSLLSLIRSPSS
jgi:hypothetical protein